MGTDLLGIGITGLRVSQSALSTTGHNISNAETEGYSRQRVLTGSNVPSYNGVGYVGNGAKLQSIERIANEFLISQLHADTAAFNQLESFTSKIEQLDNLVANESTSLSSGLEQYFAALQTAADDPAAIPARQLVLSQADVISERFHTLAGRFDEINNVINQELDSIAGSINSLANGIARLNESITQATGAAQGAPPNDLLDQRDQLLRELNELVGVQSVQQGDGMVNVFIGKGQPLVIGGDPYQLQAVSGRSDPFRRDIAYVSGSQTQIVSRELTGGQLGGLLDFRNNVLDRATNELGRIALVFADVMNRQQANGLDLNGNYGEPIFQDINNRQATLNRVGTASTNAPPADRVVSVTIEDPAALTNSDYELTLPGPGDNVYRLTRISDGEVVAGGALTSARPAVIEADGFAVHLEEGTFQQGDRFRIQPTRKAGQEIDVIATAPEMLAFAAPIRTDNTLSNLGTGKISQGEALSVLDPATGERRPAFEIPGYLSPPLVVRFTSPTTYDVLDNTDPANPRPLEPPLMDQPFVPGQTNVILPEDDGQTVVTSDGINAGRIPNGFVTIPPGSQPPNTFINETVTISYTDPESGQSNSFAPVNIAAGTPANQIAATLSQQPGVSALASSFLQFTVTDDGIGQRLEVNLNGQDLTAPLPGPTLPPQPLTPDYLAEQINANGALGEQGIRAVSDGVTVKLYSSKGVDLELQVAGDPTDGLNIKGDDGAVAFGTTDLSNGADFDTGGPTSFTLDLGGGARTISLSGQYDSLEEVVGYVQNRINTVFNSASKIQVEAADDGTLRLRTVDNTEFAQLQVGGISNDVLGLTSAAAAGVIQPDDITSVPGAGPLPTRNGITVGGKVHVTLDENYSLDSDAIAGGNIFARVPEARANFFGYTVSISGNPEAGDTFTVGFNSDGVSDNRNALAFVELESAATVDGRISFQESYGQLVEYIGNTAGQAMINRDASENILFQTEELRNSISGVNLDEEAANLIKYELAYNASSQVIRIARDIFDTLIGAFR